MPALIIDLIERAILDCDTSNARTIAKVCLETTKDLVRTSRLTKANFDDHTLINEYIDAALAEENDK